MPENVELMIQGRMENDESLWNSHSIVALQLPAPYGDIIRIQEYHSTISLSTLSEAKYPSTVSRFREAPLERSIVWIFISC